MKNKFLILNALFFYFGICNSQVLTNEIKIHQNFNYDKLSQIDTLLNQYIRNNWEVGAVVLIVKDNQVILNKGYGYSNLASKNYMQSNAIFRIMSQTKAITSFGIMQLFEQGKLDLDQNISDFIPEFKNPKVLKDFKAKDSSYTVIDAKREITFRDLLTHTSGIDYAAIGNDKMTAIYAKNKIPSGLGSFNDNLLTKMKALGKLPLIHNPGEKFTYGLNSDLLGCLIEIISGKTLDLYFKENIFEPLGMKDSHFNVPAEKAERLPTVYTENKEKNIILWEKTHRNIDPNYPLIQKTYFSGGAGLSTTAFDYAIFLQMLLNGGVYNEKQILGKRTVEIMLSPQLADGMFRNDNFSLGFSITSEKNAKLKMRNAGTFSWGGYYGTTYWADPKEKLVVLIMSQHMPNSHNDYQKKIENIIYGSLK